MTTNNDNVVCLKQPISDTETDRQRFEVWATGALRADEASSLLARSRGGDYVLATARAAWAAWQAGRTGFLVAAKRQLSDPRARVLHAEEAVRSLCQLAGEDPADAVMVLLTAAAHLNSVYSVKSPDDTMKALAKALGCATVAAEEFFGGKR
jgi:hypothetical protein